MLADRQHLAFGLQHGLEVGHAGLEARAGQLRGLVGVARGLHQALGALRVAVEAAERALGFFQRQRHGLLEHHQALLGARLAGRHARSDGAEVERCPRQAHAKRITRGVAGEQVAQPPCVEAQQARQGHARVQLAARDADAGRGRRQLALGGDHVGPALQPLLRRAHRQRGQVGHRQRRQRTGQRHVGQHGARWLRGERGQAIGRGLDARLQRGQQGLGAGHERARAGHVELARATGLEPRVGDAQRLALVHEAGLGDAQALLQAAQFQVVARHLGRHGGVRGVQASLARAHLSGGGLAGAPHATEQVELPAGDEAGVEAVAGALAARGTGLLRLRRHRALRAALDGHARARGGVGLALQRPRLLQARLRKANVGVGGERTLDQRVQRWVVEAAPEACDVLARRLGVAARGASVDEALVERDDGRLVVGAHGRTAGEQRGQGDGENRLTHVSPPLRLARAGAPAASAAAHRTPAS